MDPDGRSTVTNNPQGSTALNKTEKRLIQDYSLKIIKLQILQKY